MACRNLLSILPTGHEEKVLFIKSGYQNKTGSTPLTIKSIPADTQGVLLYQGFLAFTLSGDRKEPVSYPVAFGKITSAARKCAWERVEGICPCPSQALLRAEFAVCPKPSGNG